LRKTKIIVSLTRL